MGLAEAVLSRSGRGTATSRAQQIAAARGGVSRRREEPEQEQVIAVAAVHRRCRHVAVVCVSVFVVVVDCPCCTSQPIPEASIRISHHFEGAATKLWPL